MSQLFGASAESFGRICGAIAVGDGPDAARSTGISHLSIADFNRGWGLIPENGCCLTYPRSRPCGSTLRIHSTLGARRARSSSVLFVERVSEPASPSRRRGRKMSSRSISRRRLVSRSRVSSLTWSACPQTSTLCSTSSDRSQGALYRGDVRWWISDRKDQKSFSPRLAEFDKPHAQQPWAGSAALSRYCRSGVHSQQTIRATRFMSPAMFQRNNGFAKRPSSLDPSKWAKRVVRPALSSMAAMPICE